MKKYLVIGNPIAHSLSPKLHNYWLKMNKISAFYEKKELDENDLGGLIEDVKDNKINGINVTVPFKKKIISHLDELSDEANKTQSVNTIYTKGKKVIGHNTDIEGFELSLTNLNFDLKNKKILILGAGGVVASIIYALGKMQVSEIIISNRTKEKANNLKRLFQNITIIDWGLIPEFDLVINATSVGLNENDDLKLDFSKVHNKIFYDIIYNPSETNFLRSAKNSKNTIQNGKMMFIYQALLAFKIWHNIEPQISDDVIKLLD